MGFSSNTRIWHRQWDVCDYMFVTTLCEVAPLGLLVELLPVGFEEASCRVVSCHTERPAQQGRWFPADHQQETEPISPTTHQELSAASNHVSLGVRPSPVKPQMRPTATADIWIAGL